MLTLFVSHGAPTLALDPGDTGPALASLGARLPRPRAVLVMSPHWVSLQPALATRDPQVAWHDFGGFPEALYHLRYDPPGAPDVAARAIELLRADGLAAQGSDTRPLDHGAWVPLRYLYPAADVPVTQVSMQPDMRPEEALRVGRALAPLADEGVLLMGSGSVTHNLAEFRLRGAGPGPAPAPYVVAFAGWLRAAIAACDLDALLDYRRRAPHAQRAHPTDEHLVPLFFAIGAALGPRPAFAAEGLNPVVSDGMLAMDAFLFGPGPAASRASTATPPP